MTRERRAVTTALFTVTCAACGGHPSVERPNVLVICIDVLRSDHVGAYGYERATTPSIDGLAASGVVFGSALSPSSWTKPSVPSYFTGRFPVQHRVYEGSREEGGKLVSDVLGEEEHTLAELFHDAGYRTVGVVTNGMIIGKFGFDQGYDEYIEKAGDAREIRTRFLEWMDAWEQDAPFFAYLHFLDVHLPYDPPESYRTAFGDSESSVDFSTGAWKLLKRRIRNGEIKISESDRRAMIDLYDGSLNFTDAQIGEVLSGLEERGLADGTMVVVLADHGEELLDRGGIGHGSSLYDELLRVPLVIRFPGSTPAGLRIDEPVSLVDVLPTLADYCGLEMPADLAGRSLLPLVRGEVSPGRRPIYSEAIHGSRYQQSIRMGEWKYIVTVPLEEDRSSDSLGPRSSLAEEVRVEVEGMPAEDGAFVAQEVEILAKQEDESARLTGPIDAIEGEGRILIMFGYRIALHPEVRITTHLGEPIDRDSLQPGDFVKVYAPEISSTEFETRRVKMREPSRSKKHKIKGRIARVSRVSSNDLSFELGGREIRGNRKTNVFLQGEEEVASEARNTDPWLHAREKGLTVTEELYHLGRDPRELTDLSGTHAEELRKLRELLVRIRAGMVPRPGVSRELDSGDMAVLRELGYAE